MNIRPLGDRVVIKRAEEEKTTASGIVLPGSAQEKANTGEVVAVGEGKKLDNGDVRAMSVKVGDTVMFAKFAASSEVKVDGDDLLVMSEDDLIAVVG